MVVGRRLRSLSRGNPQFFAPREAVSLILQPPPVRCSPSRRSSCCDRETLHYHSRMSGMIISKGSCTVLFAYDLGFGISLERAEQLLARHVDGSTQRGYLRHARKSPRSFEYRPAPLRVMRTSRGVQVGEVRSDLAVSLTMYDFGAVSVAYTFPLTGSLEDLARLSCDLYDHEGLAADSKVQAEALMTESVQTCGAKVHKPASGRNTKNCVIQKTQATALAQPTKRKAPSRRTISPLYDKYSA